MVSPIPSPAATALVQVPNCAPASTLTPILAFTPGLRTFFLEGRYVDILGFEALQCPSQLLSCAIRSSHRRYPNSGCSRVSVKLYLQTRRQDRFARPAVVCQPLLHPALGVCWRPHCSALIPSFPGTGNSCCSQDTVSFLRDTQGHSWSALTIFLTFSLHTLPACTFELSAASGAGCSCRAVCPLPVWHVPGPSAWDTCFHSLFFTCLLFSPFSRLHSGFPFSRQQINYCSQEIKKLSTNVQVDSSADHTRASLCSGLVLRAARVFCEPTFSSFSSSSPHYERHGQTSAGAAAHRAGAESLRTQLWGRRHGQLRNSNSSLKRVWSRGRCRRALAGGIWLGETGTLILVQTEFQISQGALTACGCFLVHSLLLRRGSVIAGVQSAALPIPAHPHPAPRRGCVRRRRSAQTLEGELNLHLGSAAYQLVNLDQPLRVSVSYL